MSNRPSRPSRAVNNTQPSTITKAVQLQRRQKVNELAAELHQLRSESKSNYGVFNTFCNEKLGAHTWLKRDEVGCFLSTRKHEISEISC